MSAGGRRRRPPSPGLGEWAAIELIRAQVAGARLPRGVSVGIGDDAAVLAPPADALVWTVDACVEGVHFDRRWLTLEDVGWRAHHAAVSDLAAMGARPVAALAGLVVPPSTTRRALSALARGQAAAAAALDCPVVGGNFSSGDALSITTTVLGRTRTPLLRSGAQVGDELWLLGDVGLAAAGLRLLQRGGRPRVAPRAQARCIAAWRRPTALLAAGRALAGRASSALDVSDGLAGDAAHLAVASGVRVIVEQGALEAALPPELWRVAPLLATTALELAVSGGEDYALLATGSARRRPRAARHIGRIEAGQGAVLEQADGTCCPLRGGFEHGRRT